jgi:hypothetical protein
MDHFIVLDNESTDDVRELLADEPDVSLFQARGNYPRRTLRERLDQPPAATSLQFRFVRQRRDGSPNHPTAVR